MIILIAAPHLILPLKNADDKLIWDRSLILKDLFELTIILGMNKVIFIQKGKKYRVKFYSRGSNSKFYALFKSILLRSDYKYSKLIRKSFIKEYEKITNEYSPNIVLISYIQTAIALKENNLLDKNINYICETHNDEWAWNKNNQLVINFESLYKVKNLDFLKKFFFNFSYILYNLSSRISNNWLSKNISKLPREMKMICLSQQDFETLSNKLNKFPLFEINPSINDLVDIEKYKNNTFFVNKNTFNLLFVGSLNMKMNKDAIVHFCNKFYPKLQQFLGTKIKVNIVGRKPYKVIKEICKENEFNLFENVSNIELISIYQTSNLLLMPFPYTCGFKLKFIEAIENGIPILGTNCVNFSKKDQLPISLFSDDAQEWLKHIELLISLDKREIIKQRENIQDYAVHYSKAKIKKEFINLLDI